MNKQNFSFKTLSGGGLTRVIIISLFATLACIGIIKAATTIGSNISTDGTITGSGANIFYGTTSIGGALTATSTLTVQGISSLATTTISDLTVTGTSALSSVAITNGTIAGITSLGVSGNATITGNVSRSNEQIPAVFVVYNDGGTYKVKRGTDGAIVSSGTDAVTQIQYAVDNLTGGRTAKEKVILKGNFTLGSTISGVDSVVNIPSYTSIECSDGVLTATNDIHTDNINNSSLFSGSSTTSGNRSIEIKNCVIDGNDYAGGVDGSQDSSFSLVDIRSSATINEASKTAGSTCTLLVGKVQSNTEYFDMRVAVDAATTFKYSLDGGNSYHNTTGASSATIVAETTADITTVDNSVGTASLNDLTFTKVGHGLTTGDAIIFTTSASDLPLGLNTQQAYFIYADSADVFHVSESLEALYDGNYLPFRDAGTGTHTFHKAQVIAAGVYGAFSAGTCDAVAPVDTWTITPNITSDIDIIGNTFKNSSNSAITLRGITDFKIKDNKCSVTQNDCFDITQDSSWGYIENNIMELTKSSGLEMGPNNHNLYITNNIVRNTRSNGSGTGGVGLNLVIQDCSAPCDDNDFTHDIFFDRNMVKNTFQIGINAVSNITNSNTLHGQRFRNISFTNNDVTEAGLFDTGVIAMTMGDVNGGSVANNYVYRNGNANNEDAIIVSDSKGIKVINNSVYENAAVGIRLQNADNCVVDSNTLWDNGSSADAWGIFLTKKSTPGLNAGAGNRVINNHLFQIRSAGTSTGNNQYGIKVDTSISDTIIAGNAVDDAEASTYWDFDGTDIQFGQNYFSGKPSQASGASGVIADNATIAHGLAAAPTFAFCTTSVADEYCTVSAMDATNITIQLTKADGSAGTDQAVYWRAVYSGTGSGTFSGY